MFDAEEADDVKGLREHLEEGHFAESGRGDAFFVHFESCFLQSNQLPGRFVLCLVHFPVRSFSHLL